MKLCKSVVGMAVLLLAAALTAPVSGQAPRGNAEMRSVLPPGPDRPLADKLRTPRETLKTLYFSVVVYDFHPQVIDDAIACLEIDGTSPLTPAEAAVRAIELEQVLRELNLPLSAAPVRPEGDSIVLTDSGDFTVSLRRQADGGWRFDRETVERVPLMRRAVLARQRNLQVERAGMREGFTDPAATMRKFLIDATVRKDYYSAAACLDLRALTSDQRRDRGPLLAQQLAYVIQHRGWIYYQEIPHSPSGPPYTWHADRDGRIAVERVPQPDGKDAWLFSRRTVTNLPRMYESALKGEPDHPYVRMGRTVPPVSTQANSTVRPDSVPTHLGSPRAVLQGFFRTMDGAEYRESRRADALEYLDLRALAETERTAVGSQLATKLEAVLRKLQIDLETVPNTWNASPQVFGEARNLRIDIVRQADGCWRFNDATIERVPALFDKLTARDRADRERTNQLESARDTMVTFLTAINRRDSAGAAQCLDLEEFHITARKEVGASLAFKLKYVIDRIGRVYVQEIPDEPDGPRYVYYHGDQGRIVIARQAEGARKGLWLFTADTVRQIEPMYRAVYNQPVHETLRDADIVLEPSLSDSPGLWVRRRVPPWAQVPFLGLDLYQWLGLLVAVALGYGAARLVLAKVHYAVGWFLHRSGSELTTQFVASKLRPLTWLTAFWLFFRLIGFLDLAPQVLDDFMPFRKFALAGLICWLAVRLIDLMTALYTNTELMRPHRSLGDMIVPVSMRTMKGVVILVLATYFVYQLGQGDSLVRFLTGLGVAGLAVSLAAQDALKNFFGTLLLIGERSFKIGDRILVNGQEGMVEQVGFRSTRLRTGDGSLLTVPNATLAAAAIDNRGVRSFRRYRTSMIIGYGTPLDQIGAFRDEIRTWLASHPKVDASKLGVSIYGLKDNGVELLLDLFLTAATSAEDKALRDEINTGLLRRADEMGIGIANNKPKASAGPVGLSARAA